MSTHLPNGAFNAMASRRKTIELTNVCFCEGSAEFIWLIARKIAINIVTFIPRIDSAFLEFIETFLLCLI